MKKPSSAPPPCRSIFQGGAAAPAAERYTQLWAALINQMVRSRNTLAGAK